MINTVRDKVSTLSRLKAAGFLKINRIRGSNGFNTQPPEGGWIKPHQWWRQQWGFNTQPPEGGWTACVAA